MKFYRMERIIPFEGLGLYLDPDTECDQLVIFKSGEPMDPDFSGTLRLIIDPEMEEGVWPAFFESPALLMKKSIYHEVAALIGPAVEVYPAHIRDTHTQELHSDYIFLNITKTVSGLNRQASEVRYLTETVLVADHVVLDESAMSEAQDLKLFVLNEDTDVMIVSEDVRDAFLKLNLEDVRFSLLPSLQVQDFK